MHQSSRRRALCKYRYKQAPPHRLYTIVERAGWGWQPQLMKDFGCRGGASFLA